MSTHGLLAGALPRIETESTPAILDTSHNDCPAIQPDAFYPAVSVEDFRVIKRVDQTVQDAECVLFLERAVDEVNRQLDGWLSTQCRDMREAWVAAEKPYQRAVFGYAKALQLESWLDYDATERVGDRLSNLDTRIIAERREALAAIALLTGGAGLVEVELI